MGGLRARQGAATDATVLGFGSRSVGGHFWDPADTGDRNEGRDDRLQSPDSADPLGQVLSVPRSGRGAADGPAAARYAGRRDEPGRGDRARGCGRLPPDSAGPIDRSGGDHAAARLRPSLDRRRDRPPHPLGGGGSAVAGALGLCRPAGNRAPTADRSARFRLDSPADRRLRLAGLGGTGAHPLPRGFARDAAAPRDARPDGAAPHSGGDPVLSGRPIPGGL